LFGMPADWARVRQAGPAARGDQYGRNWPGRAGCRRGPQSEGESAAVALQPPRRRCPIGPV